jgi:hypothetical protein
LNDFDNFPEGDSPASAAEAFAARMQQAGYSFDFSLRSLLEEVDRLLDSPYFTNHNNPEQWPDEARLTAYVGETLVRLYAGVWTGQFYVNHAWTNFYTCSVQFGEYAYKPSHFLDYQFSNGKNSTGTFAHHLQRVLSAIQRGAEYAIKFGLGTAEHGWLPVHISVRDTVINFHASDVPNNPIENLINAMLNVCHGRDETVWWNLEPAGYQMEFITNANDVFMKLWFSETSAFGDRWKADHQPVLVTSGSRYDVLLPIFRAVRKMEIDGVNELHWPPTNFVGLREVVAVLNHDGAGSHIQTIHF